MTLCILHTHTVLSLQYTKIGLSKEIDNIELTIRAAELLIIFILS